MTINKTGTDSELTVAVEGRLDTLSSPELGAVLNEALKTVDDLTLDFDRLEYISSAGLRVLLAAQTTMDEKNGTMRVINVNEPIMEAFVVTGFSDFLTIE